MRVTEREALRDILCAADNAALQRAFERHEWKMGNGQCWICYGAAPSFYPHPCHPTPDTIGHKENCEYAAAMVRAGCSPIMVGTYKPEPIDPSSVRGLRVEAMLRNGFMHGHTMK